MGYGKLQLQGGIQQSSLTHSHRCVLILSCILNEETEALKARSLVQCHQLMRDMGRGDINPSSESMPLSTYKEVGPGPAAWGDLRVGAQCRLKIWGSVVSLAWSKIRGSGLSVRRVSRECGEEEQDGREAKFE